MSTTIIIIGYVLLGCAGVCLFFFIRGVNKENKKSAQH
jgi:hypothetical protein